MPKETIASCYKGAHLDMPDTFYLQIIWGRENGVQIATTNPEAPLGTVESGLYVDLDREGLNHSIRALRKARDQAFGRDE